MEPHATPVSSAPRTDAWLADIYRANNAYVWHTLRRFGVPEKDRADLAQDVFVVVHRHRDAYDATRPVRPWLFGIAFRIARRYADKHANRFEVLLDAPDASTAAPQPDVLVDRNRTKQRMVGALNRLDAEKRAAFVLCEVEGLSVPQAAALLEENVNTVGARLRAARLHLHSELREPARGVA